MKHAGNRFLIRCLVICGVVLVGDAAVGYLRELKTRRPPTSPVGTFDFTFVDGWMREGPPEGDADWHVKVVFRPDGTLRYEWSSPRDLQRPTGALDGTWYGSVEPHPGVTCVRWYLRIPGRAEPDRTAVVRTVTDEVVWYQGSGWWMSSVDLASGTLLKPMWWHRRDPRP